jgi:ribonuclease/clavin/mitogillin
MYQGKDGFTWGVHNCDSGKKSLLEYPIFGDSKTAPKSSSSTKWQKEKLTSGQPATPLRVVFSNCCGAPVLCGVMTHSKVDANGVGSDFFTKCT